MHKFRRFLLAVIFFAMFTGTQVVACPNCKEAVEAQTGEGERMKDGYYYSILFMVAMPFTLLGSGVYLVTRAVRRGAWPEM